MSTLKYLALWVWYRIRPPRITYTSEYEAVRVDPDTTVTILCEDD